jgi:hypothetical protein
MEAERGWVKAYIEFNLAKSSIHVVEDKGIFWRVKKSHSDVEKRGSYRNRDGGRGKKAQNSDGERRRAVGGLDCV